MYWRENSCETPNSADQPTPITYTPYHRSPPSYNTKTYSLAAILVSIISYYYFRYLYKVYMYCSYGLRRRLFSTRWFFFFFFWFAAGDGTIYSMPVIINLHVFGDNYWTDFNAIKKPKKKLFLLKKKMYNIILYYKIFFLWFFTLCLWDYYNISYINLWRFSYNIFL